MQYNHLGMEDVHQLLHIGSDQTLSIQTTRSISHRLLALMATRHGIVDMWI
jgi:hypothetical protein